MIPVYQCELCGEISQGKPLRCKRCNYPKLKETNITEEEYCKKFGHSTGNMVVPGTAVYKGDRFETAAGEIGWPVEEPIYTHEHVRRCARCGWEERYRCTGE